MLSSYFLISLPLISTLVTAAPSPLQTAAPAPLTNGERLQRGLPVLPKPRLHNPLVPVRRAGISSSPASPQATGSVCMKPASQYALSCTSAAPEDTCCNTSPGGHLLQTQFWDTGSSSTGPADSWTVHGLWPDNCDGTYDQYCDPSRELTNVTQVLQNAGKTDLLSYMQTYWKDYQGDDETFWEHEYNKHGTCISSLEPRCFVNYYMQEDAITFFQRAVDTFKTLPTYDTLAAAGIIPSLTATYNLADITNALETAHGGGVNVNCASGSVFDEVWYHFVSQGSVADGNLVPAPLVGSASTCPSTGIHYYPKYTTIPAAGSSGSGGNVTDGSVGKLYVISSDNPTPVDGKSFSTKAGLWFLSGTIGKFTATAVTGGSYTITSSAGLCAIQTDTTFLCGSSVATGTEFLLGSDGTLSHGGSTAFSADNKPSANTGSTMYGSSTHSIPLTLRFIAN